MLYLKILKNIKNQKTPFINKVLLMFKGVIISQILGVLGALFLAKMYQPKLYGLYSVFISIVTILNIFNTLKFPSIIIIEKDNKKALTIVNSLFVIISIFTLIYTVLFSLTNTYFLKNNISLTMLMLSVVVAFFFSLTRTLESYSIRKSLFKVISFSKILTTSSTVFFQFLLFYIIKDSGLFYGYLISVIITFSYYYFKVKINIELPKLINFKGIINSHINILKFGFPSGLVNTIAINIIPILLLAYFSRTVVGVYALSLKIVSIPMLLITSSISQVYFQKASQYFNHNKEKLYDLTKKIVLSNILIMLIVLLLINTIGIYLLEHFFDKDWVNLRNYILILSFYILGQITFVPISSIIIITNRMQLGLIFNIILLIINTVAILAGSFYNNIMITIKIISFIGGFSYVFLLFYFLNLLKSYKNE